MKKISKALLMSGIAAAMIYGCTGSSSGPAKQAAVKPSGHPVLTEQEMLTPCQECHQAATPEVYEEWYNSRHGIDNVKCFQCHGTYEELKRVPDQFACAVCHSAEFQHTEEGKSCWDCHPAHKFVVHK